MSMQASTILTCGVHIRNRLLDGVRVRVQLPSQKNVRRTANSFAAVAATSCEAATIFSSAVQPI